LQRTPEGAGLRWSLDIPPGLAVALDAADLAEAVGALGENAARHARAAVAFDARVQDGKVWLSIRDDGPGIPADRRAEVLSRHVRADTGGTGLGLSIAADIARAAGGDLVLSDAEHGRAGSGLTATLILPAARAPKS
jgi:signal transduction histidine kinase